MITPIGELFQGLASGTVDRFRTKSGFPGDASTIGMLVNSARLDIQGAE